jgi:hypothetical protein
MSCDTVCVDGVRWPKRQRIDDGCATTHPAYDSRPLAASAFGSARPSDILTRMTDTFAATLAGLQRGDRAVSDTSRAFLGLLPINGATVATVGDVMGNETLSATNEVARKLDEHQFDLREGPCWDAVSLVSPVLETDFARNAPERWPSLYSALQDVQIGSIFAFPMTVGTLRVGAVDLYAQVARGLDPQQQRQASAMADAIARRILRDALAADPDQSAADTPFSRRVVHQATGFVLAQLGVTPDDATLLIQAHAFTSGQTMIEVSENILSGSIAFARVGDRIEVRS